MDEYQISDELAALGVVAKKQQASVQAAVDSLAATSAALAKQLAALQAATPAVRKAAEEGAIAARALDAASGPVIARLEAAISGADNLERKLQAAVAWFSWRLAGRIGLVFGAGIVVLWLICYAGLWWEL